MLLPFLIAKGPRIWASADGRVMLRIYAAQVGVMVSIALVFRFFMLG
jgi:hypothetical protein